MSVDRLTETEQELLAALKAALKVLHSHRIPKKAVADQMRTAIAMAERQ